MFLGARVLLGEILLSSRFLQSAYGDFILQSAITSLQRSTIQHPTFTVTLAMDSEESSSNQGSKVKKCEKGSYKTGIQTLQNKSESPKIWPDKTDKMKSSTDGGNKSNRLKVSGGIETSTINRSNQFSKSTHHHHHHHHPSTGRNTTDLSTGRNTKDPSTCRNIMDSSMSRNTTDPNKPKHSVRGNNKVRYSEKGTPHLRSAAGTSGTSRIRSVVAAICANNGATTRSSLPRDNNMNINKLTAGVRGHDTHGRNKRRSSSGRVSSSCDPNIELFQPPEREPNVQPSQLPEVGPDPPWKLTKKMPDGSAHLGVGNKHRGVQDTSMIPLVQQMFSVHHSMVSLDHHSLGGAETKVIDSKTVTGDMAKAIDSRLEDPAKTKREGLDRSDLEDGEIFDSDGPHEVLGCGKQKRKYTSTRKARQESVTGRMPKKFVDTSEIVDLHLHEGSAQTYRCHRGGPTHCSDQSGIQWVKNRSSPNIVGQFLHKRNRKTRSQVNQSEPMQPKIIEVSPKAEMSPTVDIHTRKDEPASSSEAPIVVLEEGEIAPDSDATIVIASSPSSGSDMSISSENSMDNAAMSIQEHSSVIDSTTTQTSTTSELPVRNLNVFAASFVPRTCVLAPDSNRTEPAGSSLTPASSTLSYLSNSQTSFMQSPQPWAVSPLHSVGCWPNTAGLASVHNIHTIPNSQTTCGMMPYVTQAYRPNMQLPTTYLPGSTMWKSSSIQHMGYLDKLDPSMGPPDGQVCREYSSQASGRQIHLRLCGEPTCPEITETRRCWHKVKQVEAKPGELEFTVMSYNILSQELMVRHRYLYSWCQETDLEWTNRGAALLTQIIAHNADIVCLQEVQEDHWIQDIKQTLAEQGYHGVYKKPAGDKPDGCAILYKSTKFLQLKVIPVEFQKGGILDRSNIGLILLLQPRKEVYQGSTRKICVATTHLLFNPRRGDIKLAQLIVFLAEIDKHAYLGDLVRDGTFLDSSGGSGDITDPIFSHDQEKSSQNHACDSSDQLKTAVSSDVPPCDLRKLPSSHCYCPIILCGDFNSEPFSDLYKFITNGYLKYDNLVARFVCGQEEGKCSGSDRTVGKYLLPANLGISETCQYLEVVKERQDRHEEDQGRQSPKINSGRIYHGMNFQSVYTHFVDPPGPRSREISTHHNNTSCTVDYIFYSKSGTAQKQRLQAVSPDLKRSGMDQTQDNDFCENQHKESNDTASTSDASTEEPLELIARYRLVTRKEVRKYGYMPNSILPSDHLCLIAKFLLR